jgi:hypothetical protein
MNAWITHCKKYHRKHPDFTWKEVLKKAKKSYKPAVQKGKGKKNTANIFKGILTAQQKALKYTPLNPVVKYLPFDKAISDLDDWSVGRTKLDKMTKAQRIAVGREHAKRSNATGSQAARMRAWRARNG